MRQLHRRPFPNQPARPSAAARAARWAVALLALIVAVAGPVSASPTASTCGTTTWTSTWNTAPAYAPTLGPWANQTLRMVARTSLGGTQLRIHLTDVYSSQPAQIGHVTVGTQLNGSTTVETTPAVVTFGGSEAVTIPAGGEAVSDPVTFTVAPGTRLLISLFIPAGANLAQAPRHDVAANTEYNYVGGDVAASQAFTPTNTFGFTTLLNGVDVSTTGAQTVVAVGDSITDGVGTGTDTDTRWPNYLADRVAASGLAVIDQGISGNWVTQDEGASGPSLLNRFQHDVLDQPGIKDIIDADGTNDLRGGVTAATLEQAQASIVASAHAANVRILLATITPCAGDSKCTPAVETQRQAYNTWVRGGSSAADGFVDPDAAVRAGTAIAAPFDSGDHLHLNSAGNEELANSIDLSLL